MSADEVVGLLDNNQKGVGKDAAKFYSLVLSPSEEELQQLGGGDKALEKYTREVMDLYAKNFNLKRGRQLGEENVVWAVTSHHARKNRGTDEGPQQENKPGLQTHGHVPGLARDAELQIILSPLGTATRCNRVQFQAQVGTWPAEQLRKNLPAATEVIFPCRQQLLRKKAAGIQRRAAPNCARKSLVPA